MFKYAADYLGLLKAGLVASGIVPLGLEKCCEVEDIPIKELLAEMLQDETCQYGLELVTYVHNIPKGSRLAVSTNLLGSIIAVCMRATQQTTSLTGSLLEEERRLVAARAILGEWLGGSGGGWQVRILQHHSFLYSSFQAMKSVIFVLGLGRSVARVETYPWRQV